MVNNSSELLDINRDQLEAGTDSEGRDLKYKRKRVSKIEGVYTQNYSRFKAKRGGNTLHVDLKLSGNFLNSLRLDHKRLGVFKIYAETTGFDLQKELEWNYGKDIFGLTDENLQRFADKNLKPYIEFEIEQLIKTI
jgi:hypothetical protein